MTSLHQFNLKFSALLLLTAGAALAEQHDEKLFNAYYAQWKVYSGFTVKSLDTSGTAQRLNILTYAFVNIGTNASGQYECTSYDSWADNGTAAGATANTSVDGKGLPANGLTGNFGQLLLLKQKYPKLKIVITIGGASLPPPAFSAMAATDASRKHFVSSCIADYIQGHFSGAFGQTPNQWETGVLVQGPPGPAVPDTPGLFDGIEIDWEYPGAADTANFTALMKEFRSQLDALGERRYLLSFDAEPGAAEFAYTDLAAVARYCSYVDLMTYDYSGPWNNETGFVAPLYQTKYDTNAEFNVAWTVDAYLAAGVPAHKILLGIPFYAYGWSVSGGNAAQHGQYEVGTPSTPNNTQSYAYIVTTAMPLMQVFRDDITNDGKTAAPWLFDGSTFWTYDDPASIRQKMDFVRRKDLGGAFAWETSSDLPDGDLGRAIFDGLHSERIF
jgi:chitinase